MTPTFAVHAGRIATMDAARENGGALDDAALVVENGRIAWIGAASACPAADSRIDARGLVVTPGLCDAHTHAAWSGSRHLEYTMKLAGRDYRDIAAAGGGIASTHRAIAAISEDELAHELTARLARMASLGVTTCEVKSGYGLEPELELKQLRAMAAAACNASLPRIVPTFLALHSLTPAVKAAGSSARADAVAQQVALVALVAREKLATFVDAYIDENAFSCAEARPALEAARDAGLAIRLHVGQFADVGGAALAAEFGAASVDHMENVADAALPLLRDAGTHIGLLPTASFVLNQAPPPVAKLRAAGLTLVVASDSNPGTAPSESLPLAMAFAVRTYGLSPDEALLGATRYAARSLGAPESGALVVGAPADFVVWDLPHEYAILQPWGVSKTRHVFRDGVEIGAAR